MSYKNEMKRSSPQRPDPQKSVKGWVLLVTGVHEEAQKNDIRDAFTEYGQVKSVRVKLDQKTGLVKVTPWLTSRILQMHRYSSTVHSTIQIY
jgi:RNA recognition motif-containing protein